MVYQTTINFQTEEAKQIFESSLTKTIEKFEETKDGIAVAIKEVPK